jgi:hypothetical protein
MPAPHRSLIARAVAIAVVGAAAIVPSMTTSSIAVASGVRAVLPSVSVADVSVGEGTGGTTTAVFTITQDKRGKSTINFSTAPDTAAGPADYIPRSGKIRFAGHKLTRTVSITIIGDALDESDETFFLKLSGAQGADLADGEATGTILDNDAPPSVSVGSPVSVPEGQTGDASFATVDVTLSAASGQDVSVDWATADGTATVADNDYVADAGQLNFAPGETSKTVLIEVVGDVASEGDETFDVVLSSPVNASLGSATDVVTIVDNDPIPPGSAVLTVTGASKREGGAGTTTLTFSVARSGETTTAVDVDFAVSDGTAGAPTDYTPITGNLAFVADQVVGTIDVTVHGDGTLEHNETLFLSLLNPSAGAAISTGQAKGTIVNDDTRTSAVVKVRAAKQRVAVRGRVSPARSGKHVVVRLFRKRSGAWVRVGLKRAALSGKTDVNGDGFADSRYASSLRRARSGRCRIVVRYPGDRRFSSSSTTKLFRC